MKNLYITLAATKNYKSSLERQRLSASMVNAKETSDIKCIICVYYAICRMSYIHVHLATYVFPFAMLTTLSVDRRKAIYSVASTTWSSTCNGGPRVKRLDPLSLV